MFQIMSTYSQLSLTILKFADLNFLKLGCAISTKVVAGTPENPSLSKRKATSSRIDDSPDRTPVLNVYDPKGPT